MTSAHLRRIAAALVALAALHATPALAQRVFVAAQGSDANPCSFALPCRTFQHAHDVVAAGGEIDVLDPAGYGAVTITKSISIQGHGFSGVSVASSGIGITINGGASDAVNLNGLLIEGGGVGLEGIRFNSGKSLVVENCLVRNMVQHGINFGSNAATQQTLSVSDSYFTELGGNGIQISVSSTGAVKAVIDRSAFYKSVIGLIANGVPGTGALDVSVTDSVASNHVSAGFAVISTPGHSLTNLMMTRITAAGNGVGIESSGATALLRISQSTVSGNTSGFQIVSSGNMWSYGDNYIDDNGANVGALTIKSKQ
jgi:hypothetical protein